MHILIYCIGDSSHGMGHVIRDIHLARALRGVEIRADFLTIEGTPGADRLEDDFLFAYEYKNEVECEYELRRVSQIFPGHYDALIIDLEHGPSRALLESVRPLFRKIVTLGGVGFPMTDPEAIAGLVDLQVYQSIGPFPPYGMSQEVWDAGKKLTGTEWLIIDPELSKCRLNPSGPIVVAMGGGDPHRLTEVVMDGLEDIQRQKRIIRGPARPPIEPRNGFEIVDAPERLARHFDGASLCICAMGMTAYEAMTAGLPCIVANWSEDHQRTARLLPVLDMGLWDEVTPQSVRDAYAQMLVIQEDGYLHPEIRRPVLDGRGSFRVAEAICELLS